MPTTPAILLRPALVHDHSWRSAAQRTLLLAVRIAFVASLMVGGSLLLAAALMVAVVAAPLAAAIALWVVWHPRATDRRARAPRT